MTMLNSTGSATRGFYSNAQAFGERGFYAARKVKMEARKIGVNTRC